MAALLETPVETDAGSNMPEITDLAYNSLDVTPGSCFFCCRGTHFDGADFAPEAVSKGAVALVCERSLDLAVPQLVVPDARAAMNRIAPGFFGNASHDVRITGITGTNGKTTTAYMLHSIFRASGDPAGLIGTIETRFGEERAGGMRTTPESVDLQRLLHNMVLARVERCAMEVTSHAIHQQRISGTKFELAVFTNLSQDHLDYHSSMDEYFSAKRALFESDLVKGALVNADDPWGRGIALSTRLPVKTFGLIEDADFRGIDIELRPKGSRFRAVGPGLDLDLVVRMPARFNVSNALAAAGAAHLQGIAAETISEGIEALATVPGRFELVDLGQDFAVIVDYAHTPAGLAGVLQAAAVLGPGRVIVVFGCGGDRDHGKRPLMGEMAAKHADLVYITSDNPRSEDPASIIRQIEQGLHSGPTLDRYFIEPDREAAIDAALQEATAGDVVVIAGKGHETYQELADRIVALDDRVVAAEALKRLG